MFIRVVMARIKKDGLLMFEDLIVP